jgi:hypothetical protein
MAGNKMCALTDCGVARHAVSKAVLPFDIQQTVDAGHPLVFIATSVDAHPTSVYTSPVVSSESFGNSLERYLQDKRTVASWETLFS